jgi:hypothetical protein
MANAVATTTKLQNRCEILAMAQTFPTQITRHTGERLTRQRFGNSEAGIFADLGAPVPILFEFSFGTALASLS